MNASPPPPPLPPSHHITLFSSVSTPVGFAGLHTEKCFLHANLHTPPVSPRAASHSSKGSVPDPDSLAVVAPQLELTHHALPQQQHPCCDNSKSTKQCLSNNGSVQSQRTYSNAQGRTLREEAFAEHQSDRSGSAKNSVARTSQNNRSVARSSSSRSTGLAGSCSTLSSGHVAAAAADASEQRPGHQPADNESSVTNSSIQSPPVAGEHYDFIESPTTHPTDWSRPGCSRHRRPRFEELRSRIHYLERENVRLATQRHDLDMRLNSLQAQYDHLVGRATDIIIEAPPGEPVWQGCCVSSSGVCAMQ
eukprot:GHVS01018745.1.p1 GENE.GHVS01018745.1~~GHVS01018745.1.p1  ORF type:complete len:351 (+),score=41.51 GHVS01018745.1:138-1055(+)